MASPYSCREVDKTAAGAGFTGVAVFARGALSAADSRKPTKNILSRYVTGYYLTQQYR